MTSQNTKLEKIAGYVRSLVLRSTTQAGSGHPTSCLSATDIMTSLFFDGFFRFDTRNIESPFNDRFILSKGHAAPLLYALWVVAGVLTEPELLRLRTFESNLEGHPSMRFTYSEVATGSLGQGLSVGLGMALASKRKNIQNHIFVLLGDGEIEEGSNWEAMQVAHYYHVNNLIGIIDVSKLEQEGETMLGGNPNHGIDILQKRVEAFGWKTIIVDGHVFEELHSGYKEAIESTDRPVMILAKTIKGKGVSFLEGQQNWHGKALNTEELTGALEEIGEISSTTHSLLGPLQGDKTIAVKKMTIGDGDTPTYGIGDTVSVRDGYGTGLLKAYNSLENMVVLDAGMGNSTRADYFKQKYRGEFYEMFIAEQNMVGVAVGLARCGFVPYISTFASFLTRAHDQIRMSQYSNAHVVFFGSHAGVSIGEDGPSQMGLEDIALFRSIPNCMILYPSDVVSMEKCVVMAGKQKGMVYIRGTKAELPVLYGKDEMFPVGGSKTLKISDDDKVVIFTAGITLHEAIKAHNVLIEEGVAVRIIDVYSIEPLDIKTIQRCAIECRNVLVIEDHYSAGGLGDSIVSQLIGLPVQFKHLCVRKRPRSGTCAELLRYEEIDSTAIVSTVKKLLE